MRKNTERKNAYFTVEAALVFPFALGVLLFVCYMLLFQYDRCLLEQDVGRTALWGSCAEAGSEEEFKEKTQRRLSQLDWGKYAAWRTAKFEVRLEKNQFWAVGEGELTFPAPGWNFWGGKNLWKAEKRYGFRRTSPAEFVRLCQRIRAGAAVEEGEETIGER